MKQLLKQSVLILTLSLSSLLLGQEHVSIDLSFDSNVTYQTIDGFGASDAWNSHYIGKNWPLEERNRIADLMFSQDFDDSGNPIGAGFSLWRFNIGAGTMEQGENNGLPYVFKNRWTECFMNPDGSYDWSKQAGQQWFLKAAKERGVEKLLAFPNSPPVYLTANGKGYAEKGRTNINLKPGAMSHYASFMVDVVEHFKGEGIIFDYLSPINEPQWNWDEAKQEGTPALNEEIYNLVKYLSHDLSKRHLSTKIVIGEAGTIGHASMSVKDLNMGLDGDGRDNQAAFFFSPSSPFYVSEMPNVAPIISAHSYFSVWPVENQVMYRQMVKSALDEVNPNLGYWMSEYCPLQENDEFDVYQGRDLGMTTGLYIARIIHHDMTITNARSWQYWLGASFGTRDCLVYCDDGHGKYGSHFESIYHDGASIGSKSLWALAAYSRFVRPGMQRIECLLSQKQSPKDGLLASAYKTTDGKRVVIVLTNLSDDTISIAFDKKMDLKSYTTDSSSSMSFAKLKTKSIDLSGKSITTLVIDK